MNVTEIARRLGKRGKGKPKTMTESAILQRQNARERKARLNLARSRGTHTNAQWQALLDEVNKQCVRCGNFGIPLEKDHILRIGMGGSDAIENLQPVCKSCNSSKVNEDFNWLEYRRVHGWEDCPSQSVLPLRKRRRI